MNFDLSEEQLQLQDLLAKFASRDYGFEHYRAVRQSAEGWSRASWQTLAELGVLAALVPERCGGLGYGGVERLVIMETLAPALMQEPLLSSAVMATSVLAQLPDPAAAALLAQMATGEVIAVLAHHEPGDHEPEGPPCSEAVRAAQGYRLSAHKAVVSHAPMADVLLVSARCEGQTALFQVPRDATGLRMTSYPTLDGHRAAEVVLDQVLVPAEDRLGDGAAEAAIGAGLDAGLAAVCAEAVGIMQAAIDATAEYLRTRKQFGQPLGRFQALQHRVADMVLHVQQARSMSLLLAMQSSDTRARQRELSAAKVIVSHASRFVGQQVVQLHGGMGMTDEMQLSHWFRRLTAIELLFGRADTHLQKFAALSRPTT